MEFLSDSTRTVDLGRKWQLYQERLRVPEYFWYDPWTQDLAGMRLHCGTYQPIVPETDGSLVSTVLGLKLVVWEGEYAGLRHHWLRWATLKGVLLPTPEEAEHEEAERQRAEVERQRQEAERQQQRNEELEALVQRYRQQFGELPE